MKKITLICSAILVLGISGCATDYKTETGGGLIDPAMSSDGEMACEEGDTRCETGGGLIDPAMSSDGEMACEDGDERCETGGGLIDPMAAE